MKTVSKTVIEARKVKSKFHHDRAAQELPKLLRGQEVYVQLKPGSTAQWTRGKAADVLNERDYQLQVGEAIYRRNRKYVRDANTSVYCGDQTIRPPGWNYNGQLHQCNQ